MEPHALFLSKVTPLPIKRTRPAIKVSDERLEALGELYVRLQIGRRHRLDFDSYVWAVQTGRWFEYMEATFPKIHYVPRATETSRTDWFVAGIVVLACFYLTVGGMFQ